MRKILIPILAGSALSLGACATSPYGSPYGYGADPLTSVLGAVLGSSSSAYGSNYGSGYGNSFSQAAVNACASTASRYGGQVGVRNVRQVSSSTLRVSGTVSNGYSSRYWGCSFRSDGRITDFDF